MLATVFMNYCQSTVTLIRFKETGFSSFNCGTSQFLKKLSLKIISTLTYTVYQISNDWTNSSLCFTGYRWKLLIDFWFKKFFKSEMNVNYFFYSTVL